MRALATLLAILVASQTGLAASNAFAKSRTGSAYNVNPYDPAGNYKSYPDWARQALGGKGTSR